jgi:hypothetical protein
MNSFENFLFVMITVKNEFIIHIFNVLSEKESNQETTRAKAKRTQELRIENKITNNFEKLCCPSSFKLRNYFLLRDKIPKKIRKFPKISEK